MKRDIKKSLSNKWLRLLFMFLYACAVYWIIYPLLLLISAFQFIYLLFANKHNEHCLSFGSSLSDYIHEIMRFLTYSADDMPFPFKKWPSLENSGGKKPASPKE